MKTIIHPTDFSENASKALAFAIDLSKRFDAELIILHIGGVPTIMNSSSSLDSFSAMEEENEASIKEQLKDYLAKYADDTGTKVKTKFIAKSNSSTIKGIVETINETSADLVVVGTKGQSKLKEMIVGSTTKALVTKAYCPVLSIPENAVFKGIKHIVYASDFDENDIEVIKRVVPVSQIYHAKISVLHLSKDESKENADSTAFHQRLSDEVNYLHLKYDTFASNNIAYSLANYLKVNQADLLVMFEKENTGINGLFHKDMVKQFVEHALTIPFMSYNIHSVHSLKEV